MERLTRRMNNTYVVEMPEKNMSELDARKTLMQNFNKCCEKLGKLEDLEEQIGMSLDDFHKCVVFNDDEFYIIVENEDTEQLEIVEVVAQDDYMHLFIQGTFYFVGESKKGREYEYPISSYGKDMFLTLEEAQKKLEEMKNETN